MYHTLYAHTQGDIFVCLGQKKIVTATATNFLGNYRNKCAIGHHCDLLFSTFQLNCCACHLFLRWMCRLPLSQTIDTLAQPKKNSNQMRVLFSYFFNFFQFLPSQNLLQFFKVEVGHVLLFCAVKFL